MILIDSYVDGKKVERFSDSRLQVGKSPSLALEVSLIVDSSFLTPKVQSLPQSQESQGLWL